MYKKCLNIEKMYYGENNFSLITIYKKIGSAYKDLDKFEQALEMYTKCLNIEKAHYGDNNINLATTYNSIGNLYK